ncbi:uncharacterized protein OCT59_022512 [Rhizophagus irregularis]|uniref:uncharacterized protein n=1 Tax=Rhizophagus irregularis TaxID=588596 RepID=UPI00331DE4AD|nr:hypothetical protein OCT59_022512 [Rhizophagus irregularis]
MTYKCNECGAMMWLDERINKSVKLPVFSTCCAKGKVILPFLQELPSPLNTLLTGTDPRSCTFRQNIRIGEDGWHPKIPIYNKNDNISIHDNNNEVLEIYSDNDETDEKYVTAMNYFAYRLQIGRSNEATTLHYFGRLFQQWIVDMYTIVEHTRLNYLRFNQKRIRAELYNGIQDAMISGDRTTNVGQRIILPSSFTGGP